MEIIEALRRGGYDREQAWEYAYKSWRDKAMGVIFKMGCSKNEALEIFGEVAMPFEEAVRKPDFALKSATLSTYFIRCVINRWLERRGKKSGEMELLEFEDRHVREVAESVEAQIDHSELAQLLDQSLSHISDRCKKILVMFMNGYKMQEIAEAMNFAGAQIAKNEKLKCQSKYEDFLRQNPSLQRQITQLRDG